MTNGFQPSPNDLFSKFTPFSQSSGAYLKPSMPYGNSERLSGSKSPKGCYLSGERVVYDVNDWLPVEVHSELALFPSMIFQNQDKPLEIGSQISANKQYIGYCIQSGTICVYNRQTRQQCLLQGHRQRVTDMAFCGDQVGLLASASSDGHVFIWSIIETCGKDDDHLIRGQITLSLQILGEWESVHPLVCWLNQDLVLGIDKYVLALTSEELKKNFVSSGFAVDNPIRCHVGNLIRGIKFAGAHDLEVTALTIMSRCPTLIASASRDGTVRIWRGEEPVPVTRFAPYEGWPVDSVSCVSPFENDPHVILTSGGPQNRELKLWVPFDGTCLIPPTPIGKWKCIETVELKNSIDGRPCQLFFNRTLRDSEASLLLVGSTQDSSIYVVHVEFEAHSAYMDYLSKFCVELPISNLTARSDSSGDGEGVVEIFCVHDQSIQLYTLYRSQCIPPVYNGSSGASSPMCYGHLQEMDISDLAGYCSAETDNGFRLPPDGKAEFLSSVVKASECIGDGSANSGFGSWIEVPRSLDVLKLRDMSSSQTTESVLQEQRVAGLSQIISSAMAASGFQNETLSDHGSKDSLKDGKYSPVNSLGKLPETMAVTNFSTCTFSRLSVSRNSHELLALDAGWKLEVHASANLENFCDGGSHDFNKELSNRDNINLYVPDSVSTPLTNQRFADNVTTASQFDLSDKENIAMITNDLDTTAELTEASQIPDFNNWCMSSGELSSGNTATSSLPVMDEVKWSNSLVDIARIKSSLSSDQGHTDGKLTTENSSLPFVLEESMKDGKMVYDQIRGVEMGNSTAVVKNSFSEGQISTAVTPNRFQTLAACTSSVQASLNTLVNMHEEFQKHVSMAVEDSMSKESTRLESSIEECLERYLETFADAMQSGFKEETSKRVSEQDVVQHIVLPVSKHDLSSPFCRTVGKEISSLGPAIARSITSCSDRMATAIMKSISQKQEIITNQLERSIAPTVGEHFLKQLCTNFFSQALQESVVSLIHERTIPLFENICRKMMERTELLFREKMLKYATHIQEELASYLILVSSTLKNILAFISINVRSMEEDLKMGQRRLMDLTCQIENHSWRRLAINASNKKINNYDDGAFYTTSDFSRLVGEGKLEDAFSRVLSIGDIEILLWLCNQVDPVKIFASSPLPISQLVLLFLMQQLACDLAREMTQKLTWIQEAATAIDPNDPALSHYIRPILEQVYLNLQKQLFQMCPGSTLVNQIKLIMHVVNSLLTSCKL